MDLFKAYCILVAVHLCKGSFGMKSSTWKRVKLDRDYLQSDQKAKDFYLTSKYLCAELCSRKSYCAVWCQDDSKTCTLSSTIVSPNYVELSNEFVICYTKNRVDLIVGAITYSSELQKPENARELTTDGIFLDSYGAIFWTIRTTNPWILFDLKQPATISGIWIRPHIGNNECNEIELKIGNSKIDDGDFSRYEYFIPTSEPCPFGAGLVYLNRSIPKHGQYISLLRRTESKTLRLYHIEVEGVYDP